MGKYEKKREKKPSPKWLLVLILVIVLALLALFVMPQVLYLLSGDEGSGAEETLPAETAEAAQTEYSRDAELSLPYDLEDGKLEIESLFSYNGINPDGGLQDVTDVAAITLKNNSDQYLLSATVTLTLQDGSKCTFAIADVPAGKSVSAFSTENTVLAADAFCVDVTCEAVFDPEASLSEEAVSVSVDGMSVTLTNVSGRELKNIVVYCHDILEPEYFGGKAYCYKIESLAAGASETVNAVDCILGLTEVVRIDAE